MREIEGLPHLKVEQAFELSDASAERSAAGCTVHLDKAPIIEYITSNITLLKWMIAEGYADPRSLARRIKAMEAWLANPQLLEGDADAEYAAVIEIDLNQIVEPIVACPNDPDDVKTLSESGYDAVFFQWSALFAPAGTPEPVIARLREAARVAAADSKFVGTLQTVQTPVQYLDAPEMRRFWEVDAKKLAEAVQRVGKVE